MKTELEQIKHARSVKQYPDVSLQEDEYVVLSFKRSRIGIVLICVVLALIIFILSASLIAASRADIMSNTLLVISDSAKGYVKLLIILAYIIIGLSGFVGYYVYNGNVMYVTNKRVIQKVRSSLFSTSMNVIELAKIEDVSYRQESFLQHILHIGTLRLSTVGDETTYTFDYLDTPSDETDTISRLVLESKKRKSETPHEEEEPETKKASKEKKEESKE